MYARGLRLTDIRHDRQHSRRSDGYHDDAGLPGTGNRKTLGNRYTCVGCKCTARRPRGSTFAPSASLLSEAIADCREGLIQEAAQRGADAVVAVHFDFEWLNPQRGNIVAASELAVVAYETAVRLKAPSHMV